MGTIKIAVFGLLAAGLALAAAPASAQTQTLEVRVDGLKNGGVIPNQYCFCVPAAQGHVAPGRQESGHLVVQRTGRHQVLCHHPNRYR